MVTYYYNAYPYSMVPGDYRQNEDEWDRSTVLDPLWEVQQKKTFTAWINSHLRKAGTRIENLEEDFQNGLKLMLLLEVISGEPMPRPDRGRTRFHRIANVNKALDYIRRRGVKLVSLGAESIVDGNQKMILGLIWTLILRFAIQNISVGDLSARDGLLLWCQRKTEPYNNVDVQNFSSSWRDGLAFCALIHRHRPDLIDYDSLNANNPINNLNLAFDVAEKHLDIPPMLDANELVEMLIFDEKSMLTYLSCFVKKFASKTQIERAANQITNELNANKETAKLAKDYDNLASDIIDWTKKWTPWLQNRNEDHSLDDATKRLNDYRHYRLKEKPLRVEEKGNLENLHDTLQTRLKLSNRPEYRPKDGHSINDINNAWKKLEISDKDFEQWLLSEIARLERLEHLAEKFKQKCNFYDEWSSGKEKLLESNDYKTTNMHSLKCLQKKHEFFETEMANHQERVEQIVEIAKELARLRYPNQQAINHQCGEICENWKTLADLVKKRRNALIEMEKVLEKLDDLHLKFAHLANPFNNWVSSTREDLLDIVIVTEMNEVERLLVDHNTFKDTLPDADNSLKEIIDLDQQIQSIVKQYELDSSLLHNPYIDLTVPQLSLLWNQVQSLIPLRDKQLQEEYSRQKNNDYLKQVFVEKSNQLGPWLERQLETVLSVESDTNEPQKFINELNEIKANVQEKRLQFNELEQINQQLQESLVLRIPDSKYTMESLRVGIEILLTSINKGINSLENQLLIVNAKQANETLLNEYREFFNDFDKDQKGLNEEQLRSFLISIGQDDQHCKSMLQQLDSKGMGRIEFDILMNRLNLDNKSTCTQMCDAFRVLAGGKSQVTPDELRRELPLEQAEHCLKAMDKFFDHLTGQYNYEAFCKSFFAQ